MPDLQESKEKEKISKFLETKDILIIDPSSPSRSTVKKCLTLLGAKVNKIEGVENFNDAKEYIEKKKPSIIVSDYKISNQIGLELCPLLAQNYPSSFERFFVLTLAESSDSIIAEAAEEDVDCFILKPYSVNSLLEAMTSALTQKVNPSPYKRALEDGKIKLNLKNTDEALAFFQSAKKMDTAPVLACFYIAQVYSLLKEFDLALESYQEALRFNSKHYPSLLGLFDLYLQKDDKTKAYETVKIIAQHFPLTSKMLTNAFELAVFTYHFEDVGYLYSIFIQLEDKVEALSKRVSAGLIVCATYLFRQNKEEEALELLSKAMTASGRQEWALLEVALVLYRNNHLEKAEETLNLIPPENRISEKFKVLDFYIFSKTRKSEEYVSFGRKLIKEGIHDPELIKTTALGLKEMGKVDVLKQFLNEVNEHYPDLEKELN